MERRQTPPRERILRAALSEFAAHGPAGARIDAIARSAEASKERLYAHFPTKHELFEAALGVSVERWLSAVPFEARDLAGWASRLFEHLLRNPEDARMLLWGQIEGAALGGVDRAQLEWRRQEVRDAQSDGVIGSDWDIDDLLTMIFGLVLAWFVTPRTTARPLEPDERRIGAVRSAVERLLR